MQLSKAQLLDPQLNYILKSINAVFEKLGQKLLLENAEFRVDEVFNSEDYIRFWSVEKHDRVSLMFNVSKYGLTFHIDRTSEIPEWPLEYIEKNEEQFQLILQQLFESEITIEYKGCRTSIILLTKDKTEIRRFTYYNGLWPNFFSSTTSKTYRPYFDD